ncbi:hypothetical protein RJT34_10340 [Clitoria ternatea]|uniref:ARM repeat superfamily protein n=1 Tax=Clitoria ternatea TaxID=43366 RepID=A0AAN9K978_CLITE
MDNSPPKHRILTLLKALKEASRDLTTTTNPFSSLFKPPIDTLLDLETKALATFSTDPNLRNLSNLLVSLRTLIENLDKLQGYGLPSLLRRHLTNYKISHLARSVESEAQACIDRITVEDLVHTLQGPSEEEEQVKVLVEFRQRLSQGFDLGFQDLVLRAKVFTLLECMLFERSSLKRVQEEAAMVLAALVKFNKNVFVGLVLMGPTIKALLAMGSGCSIKVLSSLISFIRSPLVDEILCSGEIPTIVGFLRSRDLEVRLAALDCVLELGYIGRREVVEAILQEGLVKILLDLQRSEGDVGEENREEGKLGNCDFGFESCVSRFAIQVEVGEGLSPEEKGEVKLEILRMVKEASMSDAEAATVCAEILWGSSP